MHGLSAGRHGELLALRNFITVSTSMTIPNYQDLMLPLLRVLAESGTVMGLKECSHRVADAMGLTDEQRQAILPSGSQTVIYNRTGWAAWYLQQANVVEKVRPGHIRITGEGQKLLAKNPFELT